MRTQFLVLLFILIVLFWSRSAVAAQTVGDTYVYRITNAYNNEPRGHVPYRVDKVDPDQVTVTVSPDQPSLGRSYTDIYANDGNWLRHPLINHDTPVDYTFSPAFPAYMAPLDSGKS